MSTQLISGLESQSPETVSLISPLSSVDWRTWGDLLSVQFHLSFRNWYSHSTRPCRVPNGIDLQTVNVVSTECTECHAGFLSSRPNWLPPAPAPSPASECCHPPPPPWFQGGGGDTLAREGGVRCGANSDEGAYTLVFYVLYSIIPLRFLRCHVWTK